MAIEKHISSTWQVETVFDSAVKTANWNPETYVPPEIQSFVQRLAQQRPDPRFSYVHLIAMTDGDYYGSNLNGDVFRTDELTGLQSPDEAAKNPGQYQGQQLPRYKTFEQAKFFKNHANGDRDPHYGDVPCAAWNEPMRRVELIVRVAKQAVPEYGMSNGNDICIELDRRGYLTVSMGTRITYEQCSVCNNTNEFIHDRCDHLANHMNEVLPDGRLVCAKNFGMRFFDISKVGVPADPGAYSLAKVASATPAPNPAFDAEVMSTWRCKHSEMTKEIPVSDPIRQLDPRYTPDKVGPPKAIPTPVLKQAMAAAHNDLDTVLSTAAAAGVVFSPAELCYLTTLAEPEKTADDLSAYRGFTRLGFDKLSSQVYSALRPQLGERSGFVAPMCTTGWEPEKLAADGNVEVADYYAFYRDALCSLSRSTFTKAAYRLPYIREMVDAGGDVAEAMHHLAYAGVCPI